VGTSHRFVPKNDAALWMPLVADWSVGTLLELGDRGKSAVAESCTFRAKNFTQQNSSCHSRPATQPPAGRANQTTGGHIPRASVTENRRGWQPRPRHAEIRAPIAERPNLLLKGSGRVNRILGPEEDLAGPLEKSLRQTRRKREH
jgi:hypothetical protein